MRVCLLVNDATLRRWQADALEYLLENEDVEVTTVLFNEYVGSRTAKETLHRAIKLREWAVVGALSEALGRPAVDAERLALDSIIDRRQVTERSVLPTIVDGWKRHIPAEVSDAVSAEADVAIRFGFGFIFGPILSAFEHGVLSFHHGDLRRYRGQPAGFWEFVHGEETAGITVQRLTETLDAGHIAAMKTVDIADVHTWQGTRKRLLEESKDMLVPAMRALRAGETREPETLGPAYSHPKGRPVLTFLIKDTMGRLRG